MNDLSSVETSSGGGVGAVGGGAGGGEAGKVAG
jgi:hypothetical protein